MKIINTLVMSMTELEKARFLHDYREEFRHWGERFSMEKDECDIIYFQRRNLFTEQLNQDIDDVMVRKFFDNLSKKIFIAHIREKRDGYKWKIEIIPVKLE